MKDFTYVQCFGEVRILISSVLTVHDKDSLSNIYLSLADPH